MQGSVNINNSQIEIFLERLARKKRSTILQSLDLSTVNIISPYLLALNLKRLHLERLHVHQSMSSLTIQYLVHK